MPRTQNSINTQDIRVRSTLAASHPQEKKSISRRALLEKRRHREATLVGQRALILGHWQERKSIHNEPRQPLALAF